jgi:glycosyltransferase involved in cell wall biosynthesis
VTGRGRDASEGSAPRPTVVHLITTLTQGGAERVLSQVVPRPHEAPGERHVVVSLADGGMFADELIAAGVEVRGLGMRPGRDVVRGTLRLAALLREVRPTLVVSWMYHACLLDLLARPFAGRGRRARMVWFLQGSLHSLAGLPWHTRLTVRLLARTSRRPEAIAVNSRVGRSHHIRAGYRPRRWLLLPNGCDTARFRPDAVDRAAVRSELGITQDAVVAITVARVHPQKDHATLIAALRSVHELHPHLELVLVGTGTERLATDGGAGLRIHGLGERLDVDRLYRAADLIVSSSLTEGLPNALLEGMASGLVPVVTDVGDCRAVVADTGPVVVSGDSEGLAAAIAGVVRLPGEERERLGRCARERVIEHYDAALARREYRALWDEAEADELSSSPRDSGPLHVVHVIARMNVGGPARILAGLLEDLPPDRFPQTLVTGHVADDEEDWFAVRDPHLADDARIVRIDGFGRAIAPLRDLRTQRRLTRLLRELGPDVVQTHTAKAGQLGRSAALRAGVPHVIHTFHGHTLHGYFPRPITALFTRLERRLARRTDDLVAIGQRVRDELLAAGVGDAVQYTVLPPGVRDEGMGDRTGARRALGLPDDGRAVVAFIGRLSGVKRPDRFLDAAELVARSAPDTVFLVVGDGDQREHLESRSREADVRFLGWRGDVSVVHAAADLIVVTSDNEGMPVTLIEAAMAGRACVTTDVGSAGEVVLDGRTGRVVACEAEAVAQAITDLVADAGLRETFGAAAREHASTTFGQDTVVARLVGLYRRGPVRPRR